MAIGLAPFLYLWYTRRDSILLTYVTLSLYPQDFSHKTLYHVESTYVDRVV